MTPVDIATFQKGFAAWLGASRVMPTLPYVEGGWESWIQIDFTAYLNGIGKQDYDIRREVLGVFKQPAQRADWVMNSNCQGATTLVFELKAQSYKSTNFVQLVQSDVAKLASTNIAPAYAAAQRYAMAAVIDQGTYNTLVGQGFKSLGFDGAKVAGFLILPVTA